MILERIRAVAAILLDQFGLIGLSIGLIGLIVFFKPTRLYFSMLWIVIAFSTFAIGYATKDAFMYLLPALLCFAIWIGLGLGGLMDTISRRFKGIPILAGIVFLLVLFVQAGLHWRQVDASGDARAETFGEDVLSLAPPGAIVFAQGDQAIFSLWYFHYALHERPDIAIVASDLLHFEWYWQTLQTTYPALNFPGPFPFVQTVVEANPGSSCMLCTIHSDATGRLSASEQPTGILFPSMRSKY